MNHTTDINPSLVAEKIQSLRYIMGMKIFQAAVLMGVDKIRYEQIESGEVPPTAGEIKKLCAYIKLSPDWINDADTTLREFESKVYDVCESFQGRKVEYRDKPPTLLCGKLQIVRQAHHFDRDQMANILGLSFQLYASYERGSPNLPKVYFDRFTNIFRIPGYWLLDDHITVDEFQRFYRRKEKMQTEAIAGMKHFRCRIDSEGGIHLPYALCKSLNIGTNSKMIFELKDEVIQLSKTPKTCFFCNSDCDLITFENYWICPKCAEEMSDLIGY